MKTKLTQEQRDYLKDRHVVVSVSTGKDSTALCCWLKENDIPHSSIFADTNWEAAETYEYLHNVLPKYIGPITIVKGPRSMEELVLHKGMFPSGDRRFCTELLKLKPMAKYFDQRLKNEPNNDFVNAVGIRWAESEARSKMPEWEWSKGFDVETWRPLLQWTAEDVFETLAHHGVPLHPLYRKGATRVGCWPCIYSRKEEIRFIANQDPARIDYLEALEERVAEAARIRHQKNGKEPGNPPAFFQARAKEQKCVPIREMVDWAKTDYGGKQYFLLEPPSEGCLRWGFCDPVTQEK